MIPETYKRMIAEARSNEELLVARQKALSDDTVSGSVFKEICKAIRIRMNAGSPRATHLEVYLKDISEANNNEELHTLQVKAEEDNNIDFTSFNLAILPAIRVRRDILQSKPGNATLQSYLAQIEAATSVEETSSIVRTAAMDTSIFREEFRQINEKRVSKDKELTDMIAYDKLHTEIMTAETVEQLDNLAMKVASLGLTPTKKHSLTNLILVRQQQLSTQSEQPTPSSTMTYYTPTDPFDLLETISFKTNLPALLHGPTGSGKTYALRLLQKKYPELPLAYVQTSKELTRYDLLGFRNSAGLPIDGIIAPVIKAGKGIIWCDELDKGDDNTNLVLKQLFSGRACLVDGIYPVDLSQIHIIATANTLGGGASLDYSAAIRQDRALLNEFSFIEWPYSDKVETEILRGLIKDGVYQTTTDEQLGILLACFSDLRWEIKASSLDIIISTRRIEQIGKMLYEARLSLGQASFRTFLGEIADPNEEQFKKLRGIILGRQRELEGVNSNKPTDKQSAPLTNSQLIGEQASGIWTPNSATSKIF